ncbi:hypothetical protein ACFL43_01895 [Thermodesulfobacteriota bacterium]
MTRHNIHQEYNAAGATSLEYLFGLREPQSMQKNEKEQKKKDKK